MANTYTIKKGDTLSKIAKANNTTVTALAKLNNINNVNLIKAGATLNIPGSVTSTAETTTGEPAALSGEDTDWKALIDEIYANSQSAQQAKLTAQYDEQSADYNKQISDAPKTYDPLKNEETVNNAMAERSRREAMANMGLSGAGGTSQTLQQSNTNNLLTSLGDINRKQQDYTDNINLALGKLSTQYGADTSSLIAQTESERNKAYLDQGNWEDTFGLQRQQTDQSKSDSDFNRDMNLYKIHAITRRQLIDKWGSK